VDIAKTVGWIGFFMGVFEVVAGLVLSLPALENTTVKSYFYYGLSTEQKIRNLVDEPDRPADSILYAGWLGLSPEGEVPGPVDVAVYGNSYAGRLRNALQEARPDLRVHAGLGPGAPVTHAYAGYERDREQRPSDVVVLGLAASYQAALLSMTPDTMGTDHVKPYSFPRYGVREGQLELLARPLFSSYEELIAGLRDPVRWQAYLDLLEKYDGAFDRFLYQRDLLDQSVMGRMLRRARQKSHRTGLHEEVYGPDGFDPTHEGARILQALLVAFADHVRSDGGTPVVMLFSDAGYENHLFELVEQTLRENQIPVVNSFDLCPASDLDNIDPDGVHFTRECDRRFADAVLEVVARLRTDAEARY
jgi:hypothetical protein